VLSVLSVVNHTHKVAEAMIIARLLYRGESIGSFMAWRNESGAMKPGSRGGGRWGMQRPGRGQGRARAEKRVAPDARAIRRGR